MAITILAIFSGLLGVFWGYYEVKKEDTSVSNREYDDDIVIGLPLVLFDILCPVILLREEKIKLWEAIIPLLTTLVGWSIGKYIFQHRKRKR